MGIGTEIFVTVFYDDEFTISHQAASAVNHLTRCSRDDGLSFFTANVYALPGTVVCLVVTGNFATGGPQPPGGVTT